MTLDILVCALVLVAVQLRISASLLSVRGRIILSVLVFVWAVLPFPWGLAPWVNSYLAGFSISSGLLAVLAIQHRIVGHYWLPLKQLRGACLMLVLMALVERRAVLLRVWRTGQAWGGRRGQSEWYLKSRFVWLYHRAVSTSLSWSVDAVFTTISISQWRMKADRTGVEWARIIVVRGTSMSGGGCFVSLWRQVM